MNKIVKVNKVNMKVELKNKKDVAKDIISFITDKIHEK